MEGSHHRSIKAKFLSSVCVAAVAATAVVALSSPPQSTDDQVPVFPTRETFAVNNSGPTDNQP